MSIGVSIAAWREKLPLPGPSNPSSSVSCTDFEERILLEPNAYSCSVSLSNKFENFCLFFLFYFCKQMKIIKIQILKLDVTLKREVAGNYQFPF